MQLRNRLISPVFTISDIVIPFMILVDKIARIICKSILLRWKEDFVVPLAAIKHFICVFSLIDSA